MKTNLYLIGPMGAGKTAVGRELAKVLGCRFFDSDTEIEKRTGVDIPYIFEKEGEAGFREREREIIAELSALQDVVIATGGGAVLDAGNRERLSGTGTVIYLQTSVTDQLHRTRLTRNRPLLQAADPRAVLERLAAARRPLYEEIADLCIDTTGRQVRSVVAVIRQLLEQQPIPGVAKVAGPCEPSPVEVIEVRLAERSYPIYIGSALFDDARLFRETVAAQQILIVTNEVVAPLYLDRVRRCFHDRDTHVLVLPDGEQHKTLATFSTIIDRLIEAEFHRDACLVALGGGVVGDVAGFAAASYQRGIDYLQVPTTLLAQVDSSVGGKTAVNHPQAKNMVGAFYQPIAVLADTDALRTLPARQLSAGLAEVIKYGLILDEALFTWLEKHIESLLALDSDALGFAIRRSCELKATIVADDEHERGRRALLNLGHTFGHALESLGGYERWLHGEAVAIGIKLAARTSQALGWLGVDECERVEALLRRARLPLGAPDIDVGELLAHMKRDKKAGREGLKVILLERIGHAVVTSAPDDSVLREVIPAGLSAA